MSDAVMGEQARESVKLLAAQIDALIRRVAAKDDEFASERRVWKKRAEKYEHDIRALKSELRAAKPAVKKEAVHGF